jgi:hypothetical protein
MRIGTMFLGKVDDLGDESIQTKFFILGVPLVPLSSYYVVGEQVGGVKGFEIPLVGKSVAFGYVRIGAWLGALLFGLFAYLDRHSDASTWIGCAICLAAGIVSTFVLGKLSKEEKLRRSMLKVLTGIGAPPSLLPADLRETTAYSLVERWKEEHGDQAWDSAIAAGKGDLLLFVLAEYHLRPDLASHALARMVAGDPASATPYR